MKFDILVDTELYFHKLPNQENGSFENDFLRKMYTCFTMHVIHHMQVGKELEVVSSHICR